jgi:hypothetical protein
MTVLPIIPIKCHLAQVSSTSILPSERPVRWERDQPLRCPVGPSVLLTYSLLPTKITATLLSALLLLNGWSYAKGTKRVA